MHPETGYKLCKFCENRARGTSVFHILIKSPYKFQF